MQKLIDQLNEPDRHFPGNFDTPKQANALLMCLCQEAAQAIKSQAAEIASLQETLDAVTRVASDAEKLVISQREEIAILKIAHEAHQTSNLKMLAILKQQAFALLKYRALCDQMGGLLEQAKWHVLSEDITLAAQIDAALEAWRAMK